MRVPSIIALTIALVARANADRYWVAYEGDDFPENEGWERVYGDENGPQQGGSNRSLEEGLLVLDSTRNHLIYDTYFRRQQINPDPGEKFICEWRMRVASNAGPAADNRVGIAKDGGGIVGFDLGYDAVRSSREGWTEPLAPGIFHTFRLESSDMVTYRFWLDGINVREGRWSSSLNESYVGFGDSSLGGNIVSFAEWDYLRFGVVPEPSSIMLVCLGAMVSATHRSR